MQALSRDRPDEHDEGDEELVGRTPVMLQVFKTIGRVAPTREPVLIVGESGTGKELVAVAIHKNSDRAGQPFIKVNSAALSPALLESELFGHEKGAFTGAVARRIGRFEQAHGGTLFLDEIGELDIDLQAKLLRVLQTGQFERVGGDATLQVDVRVLAATNRDLPARIAEGRFREDLLLSAQRGGDRVAALAAAARGHSAPGRTHAAQVGRQVRLAEPGAGTGSADASDRAAVAGQCARVAKCAGASGDPGTRSNHRL